MYGHMRIERVGLEDHGEAALRGGHVVHYGAIDKNIAFAHRFEPGDHAQQRRLAAAGRPDEDDELAILHIEVDAMNHGRRTVPPRNPLQLQCGHGPIRYLTPADAMPVVMYFWRKAKTSVTGSKVMTVMASR